MKSLLVGTSTIVLSVCAQGLYAQEMTASDLRRDGGDTREEEVAEDETIVISGKFQNSLINRLPIEPVELPFSLETIDADTIRERGFINPLDFLENSTERGPPANAIAAGRRPISHPRAVRHGSHRQPTGK